MNKDLALAKYQVTNTFKGSISKLDALISSTVSNIDELNKDKQHLLKNKAQLEQSVDRLNQLNPRIAQCMRDTIVKPQLDSTDELIAKIDRTIDELKKDYATTMTRKTFVECALEAIEKARTAEEIFKAEVTLEALLTATGVPPAS